MGADGRREASAGPCTCHCRTHRGGPPLQFPDLGQSLNVLDLLQTAHYTFSLGVSRSATGPTLPDGEGRRRTSVAVLSEPPGRSPWMHTCGIVPSDLSLTLFIGISVFVAGAGVWEKNALFLYSSPPRLPPHALLPSPQSCLYRHFPLSRQVSCLVLW